MVVWSAIGHVTAVALALVSPGSVHMNAPQVIAVELVAPPGAAAARPAPRPPAPEKPAPAPEKRTPVPPVPEAVVLPEKPSAPPEPKPEKKPEPKPEASPREVFQEPEVKEEKSLEDLMAELRGDSDEPAPEAPAAAPAGAEVAAVPSPGVRDGVRLSAEERDWHARVKRKMKQVWVVPPGFRTQPLETHVEVELDAAGNLIGEPRVSKRSGNPWFDEGVVRGLTKADPLPVPPDAGVWPMVFRPGDSL